MVQNKQNSIFECAHSPHSSITKLKEFVSYLFCKGKYYNRVDNSTICHKCHTHIRTPRLYRSPLFLLIYGLAVFGLNISILSPSLRYPGNAKLLLGLFCLSWLIFDKIFIAAIFTFGKWQTVENTYNCSKKYEFWPKHRFLLGVLCAIFSMFLIKVLM